MSVRHGDRPQAGGTSGSTPLILLGVLLALPTGVPAMIGYYVVYGLLAQLPGATVSSSNGSGRCTSDGGCQESSTGDAAVWFTYTVDLVGVLALIGAAIANVLLWRMIARRRAR